MSEFLSARRCGPRGTRPKKTRAAWDPKIGPHEKTIASIPDAGTRLRSSLLVGREWDCPSFIWPFGPTSLHTTRPKERGRGGGSEREHRVYSRPDITFANSTRFPPKKKKLSSCFGLISVAKECLQCRRPVVSSKVVCPHEDVIAFLSFSCRMRFGGTPCILGLWTAFGHCVPVLPQKEEEDRNGHWNLCRRLKNWSLNAQEEDDAGLLSCFLEKRIRAELFFFA